MKTVSPRYRVKGTSSADLVSSFRCQLRCAVFLRGGSFVQYQERESDVLNPETEIHYALLSSYNGRLFPHYHDFF